MSGYTVSSLLINSIVPGSVPLHDILGECFLYSLLQGFGRRKLKEAHRTCMCVCIYPLTLQSMLVCLCARHLTVRQKLRPIQYVLGLKRLKSLHLFIYFFCKSSALVWPPQTD